MSGVKLNIRPAAPMVNITNAVNPATGYAMSVFTVTGNVIQPK